MFNQRGWINFGWDGDSDFIYDYLKSREALIILLTRDPLEIYLSQQTLNISHRAHVTEMHADRRNSSEITQEKLKGEKITLSLSDYTNFLGRLHNNRNVVRRFCRDYSNFVEIDYQGLQETSSTPLEIGNRLETLARSKGLWHNGTCVSFPKLLRNPPQYDTIFRNLEELKTIQG
jgi:hypothetical protein